MIIGKIDVTKIDKAKLFKGEKGTYLDIVLIDTPNGNYGDYMICQGTTKEEREAGVKGKILGNAKNFKRSGPPQGRAKTARPEKAEPAPRSEDDDVPF